MIYIVYYELDYQKYILSQLNTTHDVKLISLPVDTTWLEKKIIGVADKINFKFYPRLRYRKTQIKQLQNIKDNDVLLLFSVTYPMDVEWIRYLVRNHKTHIWVWNPITPKLGKYINSTKKTICWYTFDSKDACTYGIKLLPQVYGTPTKKIGEYKKNNYDYIFIGKEKGRLNILIEIKQRLDALGLLGKIILVDSKTPTIAPIGIEYQHEYINYEQVLHQENESNILIDVVQTGQQGITLRVLEALFLQKKLITNNLNIPSYPWYSPKNVFIIGKDNWNGLESFIHSEMDIIPDTLIKMYQINNWINQFK